MFGPWKVGRPAGRHNAGQRRGPAFGVLILSRTAFPAWVASPSRWPNLCAAIVSCGEAGVELVHDLSHLSWGLLQSMLDPRSNHHQRAPTQKWSHPASCCHAACAHRVLSACGMRGLTCGMRGLTSSAARASACADLHAQLSGAHFLFTGFPVTFDTIVVVDAPPAFSMLLSAVKAIAPGAIPKPLRFVSRPEAESYCERLFRQPVLRVTSSSLRPPHAAASEASEACSEARALACGHYRGHAVGGHHPVGESERRQ